MPHSALGSADLADLLERLAMLDDRVLRTVAWVAWLGAGACWFSQAFTPWTSRGVLSVASSVDAFRLARSGLVDNLVPVWIAPFLMVLPAVGLGMVALLGLRGALVKGARVVLALVGASVVVLTLAYLAKFDPGRLGPGGWLSVAGAFLAIAGVAVDRRVSAPVGSMGVVG